MSIGLVIMTDPDTLVEVESVAMARRTKVSGIEKTRLYLKNGGSAVTVNCTLEEYIDKVRAALALTGSGASLQRLPKVDKA